MPSVEEHENYERTRRAIEELEKRVPATRTAAREPGTEIVFVSGGSLFVPDSFRKLYSVYGYEYEDTAAKLIVLVPWHDIKRLTTYLP